VKLDIRRTALGCTRLVCLLSLWMGSSAAGVIIDSVDGAGNATAPSPDPGWSRVGTRGSLTVVHLGDGWILTANHVGAGDVVLGGIVYPYLPGSAVRLSNGDGTLADLLVFAIDPHPAMPLLSIVTSPLPLGTELTLIGNGRNRGSATSWDANGPPPPGPIEGYEWASGSSLRWGTNHVEDYSASLVLGTWSFSTIFDQSVSADESQAANGDSGGAAFVFDGSEWALAGVLYALAEYSGQPTEASLYGQITYVADLSVYRDEILEIVSLPEPSGGLIAGVIVLGLLRRHCNARALARHR
jgi:hypothetical protein